LYNHFVTTFTQLSLSYSHSILTLSLPFLSPLFLTNEKREKEGCQIGCTKWLFKYHCSSKFYCTSIFVNKRFFSWTLCGQLSNVTF